MIFENFKYDIKDWLPTTNKEVELFGWDELDVILFTGDAYVDHPAFGIAVIGRVLQNMALKVAIVPQPNWRDDLRDFKKLGKPKLFFGLTAGNMDSMVNHYTANKRLRSTDAFTPGNKSGYRPDYPTIVYSKILKQLFPDVPVIIGGIEASLRRLAHYDYWSDKIKPGILVESKADLLVYGMGEKSIIEIVKELQKGKQINEIRNIPQTAWIGNKPEIETMDRDSVIELYPFQECIKDKAKFAKNFKVIEEESNKVHSKTIFEKNKNSYIVVNPPFPVLNEKEIDSVYDLPYTRLPHPRYFKKQPIPAYEMIRHSVNIHRGCFGGCSFCTISAHQGKFVSSRSEKSILKEVEAITKMPGFKGYITDLGGPSANMYKMEGIDQTVCEKCKRPSCIYPGICKNLNYSHQPLLNIYNRAAEIKNVKKVSIGSGVRYDICFEDESGKEYLTELIKKHVSGRLKVAPEHTEDNVLKLVRKPSFSHFMKLKDFFEKVNKKHGLNQQLIPYFISSLPESKLEDMAGLAIKTKQLSYRLEQVQDFTPTPMTLASVMHYTGINPYTIQKVYVPKTENERRQQNILFFWYKKDNQAEIKKILNKIKRPDLIGRLLG